MGGEGGGLSPETVQKLCTVFDKYNCGVLNCNVFFAHSKMYQNDNSPSIIS